MSKKIFFLFPKKVSKWQLCNNTHFPHFQRNCLPIYDVIQEQANSLGDLWPGYTVTVADPSVDSYCLRALTLQ